MMRKRIGVFGVSEEALRLVELLSANPQVEITRFWDADRRAALERARALDPAIAAELDPILTDDVGVFMGAGDLSVVIDTEAEGAFARSFPDAADRGMQIVTPLTARLLWGYGVAARDRKSELLQALAEVVESVDLTIDSDELFTRMLEIAVGVTGAEGGSLMLLDPESRLLSIRVALGVEPELWPKIRVPLGEGIAGKVAADARPLRLRGRADRQAFQIVRERLDVESALCVPLVESGRVLGVLNVHDTKRADAFSESDLEFMEQLAHLDAQIIARAQDHEALRNQAARYDAVREVHGILAGPDPLLKRLGALCRFVADRVGRGIANIYLHDAAGEDLHLAATSLEGGGFGGEYRIIKGQGIDGQVAASGKSQILRGETGAMAYAALPLLAGERLVGVLAIQAGGNPPRGRAAEEAMLEIAAAAAEGIAQAEREAKMTARATRVSAINETGIRMISAEEIAEVTRLATSSAALILEADHAVLRLRDEESRHYVIRSYYGPADGRLQERLFRLDKRVSVEVIKRRTALLATDLDEHEDWREFAGDLRSLMATPLKRDGQVVGTLAIYDKVAADRFYADRFSDEDFQIFTKFTSYVERALANAIDQAHARQHRNFDDETGLPNAGYLAKRIQEEIARAGDREGALAVALCRVENLEQISSEASPGHAHRVILRMAEALRAHVRDFDVVGRRGPDQFAVLMPEPGPMPGERVVDLARAVADRLSNDESLNDPVRIALAFGYALHPQDGSEREQLLERASEPRIRMI